MYTSNRFPSTVNMMHGLFFIINSESYYLLSSSTVYVSPCYMKELRKKAFDSNKNAGTPKKNPTKCLNDINQTLYQCHPLDLQPHQVRQEQEEPIQQRRKEAGGTCCICQLFLPSVTLQLNSNFIWLNL
jgi:hypothetical protein